jgi:hypothetical protein
MFNYIVLFIAIALSVVAAYYSIVGLAFIFSAAMIPVIVMGSVLEAAKVVSASWLYQNWSTAPTTIKYYLTAAVCVLIFITSMGIFGFLSKAHIDQNLSTTDNSIVLKNLEREVRSEENAIANAQRSLDILDNIVSSSDPKDANFIRNRQKRERDNLNNEIRTASQKINQLSLEMAPLKQKAAELEAEVGPIKYVADLIYGESDKQVLEKAVRLVIIIIVLVFDPLAIILLIAANHSMKTQVKPKKSYYKPKTAKQPLWALKAAKLKEKKKRGIVEIDKNSIVEMK